MIRTIYAAFLPLQRKGLLKNSLFNSPGIDKMFGAVSPRQTYDRTSRRKSAREKDELYSFMRSVRFFLLRLATPLDKSGFIAYSLFRSGLFNIPLLVKSG